MLNFKIIHMLTMVVWIGGIVFFSFILTPSLFKNLAREITSQVLDVIFPKYYLMGYICSVVALISSFFAGARFGLGLLILLTMLGLTFYAGLSLYPKAHKLKVEMKGYETEEAIPQEIRDAFKSSHRQAVLLNIAVLGLGLVYFSLLCAKPIGG